MLSVRAQHAEPNCRYVYLVEPTFTLNQRVATGSYVGVR